MKYEHTLVLTAELSKIIDADHSDDLSERFAGATKKLLGTVVDNVNVVRCQDFIRETNEEEDKDHWIRFDPYDRLTWPPEYPDGDPETVLVCSEDGYIYFGTMCFTGAEAKTKPTWWLSNTNEDVQVPLDVVKAWQPVPPVPWDKDVMEVEAI